MMRLLGILSGSLLAVALLLYVVGIPGLSAADKPAAEATAQLEIEPAPIPQPAPEPEPEPAPEPAPLPEPEPVALPEPERIVDVVEQPRDGHEQWFAFWSPFRTEIAANGFVAQLQRTTGIDYRVVRESNGAYEVAFAYGSEDEIAATLEIISAATGLNLSEAQRE